MYRKDGFLPFKIVSYDNGDIRHIYIDSAPGDATQLTILGRYNLFMGTGTNDRSDAGIWFKGMDGISNDYIITYLNNNSDEQNIDFSTSCPNIALLPYESSGNYQVFPTYGLASLFATVDDVNIGLNLLYFETQFTNCNGDSKCISSYKVDFDTLVEKYSRYCNDVYSKCNYNDAIVTECFNIDKKIGDIKDKFNIGNISSCGLSERIIKWVANIFKWVKYFMPALVVIITLLDFIKAIGSQNDDDMKKAQSKLVRRLIVAALFFIIPFLIQYTLEAFNLVTDNPYCNLI